jgi:hypothetical protein
VGAELFRADRQTYMVELIIAFRNFANARKMTYKIFAKSPAVSLKDSADNVKKVKIFAQSLCRYTYMVCRTLQTDVMIYVRDSRFVLGSRT